MVSLCILTYTQERYIRETVEGALSQDYPNLEIVISDDNSTDSTFRIIKEMTAGYVGPHSLIVNQNSPNKGIIEHVNRVVFELSHGDYIMSAKKLMEYLDSYDGDYCVQSFHPRLVHWFRKNRPEILRGQLSTVFAKSSKAPWIARFLATNLMTNFYAKPDFISYDIRHMNQFSYRLMRKLYTVENATWVVQSKEDIDKARDVFDIMIFDSFDPGRK